MSEQKVEELSKKVEELSNIVAKLVPIPVKAIVPIIPKEIVPNLVKEEDEVVLRIEYHPNGATSVLRYVNRKTGLETLSSDTHEPSSSYYDENYKNIRKIWKKNGEYYREKDLPTVENYYPSGKLFKTKWLNANGRLHRLDNKPCHIEYDENGKIMLEEYLNDGEYSSENKWDCIEYKDGKVYKKTKELKSIPRNPVDTIKYVIYNNVGKIIEIRRHVELNSKLPTSEIWDSTGEFKIEDRWEKYNNIIGKNVNHRLIEPAQVLYHCGKPFLSNYFENGVLIKSEYHDLSE